MKAYASTKIPSKRTAMAAVEGIVASAAILVKDQILNAPATVGGVVEKLQNLNLEEVSDKVQEVTTKVFDLYQAAGDRYDNVMQVVDYYWKG